MSCYTGDTLNWQHNSNFKFKIFGDLLGSLKSKKDPAPVFDNLYNLSSSINYLYHLEYYIKAKRRGVNQLGNIFLFYLYFCMRISYLFNLFTKKGSLSMWHALLFPSSNLHWCWYGRWLRSSHSSFTLNWSKWLYLIVLSHFMMNLGTCLWLW